MRSTHKYILRLIKLCICKFEFLFPVNLDLMLIFIVVIRCLLVIADTSGNRGRPIKRSFIDENNPTLPPAKKVSPSPQQSSLILSSTSVDPQENPKSVPSEATVNPGANDDIDENDRDYNPSPITKSDQSLPNDSGDKSNSNKVSLMGFIHFEFINIGR